VRNFQLRKSPEILGMREYVYIYIERERERERKRDKDGNRESVYERGRESKKDAER